MTWHSSASHRSAQEWALSCSRRLNAALASCRAGIRVSGGRVVLQTLQSAASTAQLLVLGEKNPEV